MTNWKMYSQIQELKRKGFTKSQAKRRLGIDYKTILKYWDMPAPKFAQTLENAGQRTKKADIYRDLIIEQLTKYPDMSSAQIYDRIKERTKQEKLPFKERAFRNFVADIRKEYNILKATPSRQYEAVEELAYGWQRQVDMGEQWMETAHGKKKIYCFAMVLSASRKKFGIWQEKPFTTATFVQAHLQAFEYYGGMAHEIVYDQDKILSVSENHGDLIYTEGFQNFVNQMKFSVYLCRGADPESKGKVENTVKYFKYGFARHRIFDDIETFNLDFKDWLSRTANRKEHGTTKKVPDEVFLLEKEYLMPIPLYSVATANNSISYQVRKDNVILYKGNRYRVPKGTYSPGKKVTLSIVDEILHIIDAETGELIISHPLCHDKGKLIGEKIQRRDYRLTYRDITNTIKKLYGDTDNLQEFLDNLYLEKKRYYRDQLNIMVRLAEEWNDKELQNGISYCNERKLFSAGELGSVLIFLKEKKKDIPKRTVSLPEKYRTNTPVIRSLSTYEYAMERSELSD